MSLQYYKRNIDKKIKKFNFKERVLKSLASKLTIWFFLLSLLPIGVLFIFVSPHINEEFLTIASDNITNQAKFLAREISLLQENRDATNQLIRFVSNQSKFIFLVNKDGIYTAHSLEEKIGNSLYNDFSKDSIKQIFNSQEGSLLNDKNKVILGYSGISQQNDIVVIAQDTSVISTPIEKIQTSSFIQIGISLIIISLAGGVVIWVLVGPMHTLAQAAEQVGKGNLNITIDSYEMEGELESLTKAFNKMIFDLKKSHEEKKQHAAFLEEEVHKRTKDIQKKKQELENKQRAILNILKDIKSEKEKAEYLAKDLEKFQLAVENASDHIVITNENGIILYANKATEKMTGFKNMELIGKKAGTKDLWGGLMDITYYTKLWTTIKKKKLIFVGQVHNKRKNGERYEAMASIAPVLDNKGNVIFFVAIYRDVTKEKEIDRAKTEFVSLASHQLRTPLSTINWYAEMLIDGDVGKLNKDQMEYMKEIYHGNKRMTELVNSLLDVSRLELGTFIMEPQPIKLSVVADEVIKESAPEIKRKNLKITTWYDKNLSTLKLDPKLTHIIVQNLFSNAVKYTPEKGEIEVKIIKRAKDILLSVKDTGMGIPENQKDKIFSKLFRADNVRQTDTTGTGLGLYILKSIIDHSGGKVWFESQENKGTTFYITIPLKGMKKKEGTKRLE